VYVRPVTPGDAAAVARIARTTWHAAYDDVLGPDRVARIVDEWYALDRLRESLDAVDTGHVVVRTGRGEPTDPDPIGFATARVEGGRAAAELDRLYALPDEWGSGAGHRLLDAVVADLRAEGVDRLRAVVLADNDVGRSFYDRRGFAVHERRTETLAGAPVETVVVVADVADLVPGTDAHSGYPSG
jgi:ribosomal protein S18 acetylase RimI-like enzyme